MEKRFWAGILILTGLLVLGLLTARAMEQLYAPAERQLQMAADAAVSGDLPEGIALARQVRSCWLRFRRLTAAAADQSPMDEMDRLFAQIQVYGQTGDGAHFAACCRELSILCRAMIDAHSPGLQNIF